MALLTIQRDVLPMTLTGRDLQRVTLASSKGKKKKPHRKKTRGHVFGAKQCEKCTLKTCLSWFWLCPIIAFVWVNIAFKFPYLVRCHVLIWRNTVLLPKEPFKRYCGASTLYAGVWQLPTTRAVLSWEKCHTGRTTIYRNERVLLLEIFFSRVCDTILSFKCVEPTNIDSGLIFLRFQNLCGQCSIHPSSPAYQRLGLISSRLSRVSQASISPATLSQFNTEKQRLDCEPPPGVWAAHPVSNANPSNPLQVPHLYPWPCPFTH